MELSLERKEALMLKAVQLAKEARGFTAPNPCVGALLVKEGQVVAKGAHWVYGGPHAEINVLNQARELGVDPSECTLFVTLEPCNHYGKTPPCSKAILEAGIREVIIGVRDPNLGVKGGGLDTLNGQGVKVELGVASQDCADLIADFRVWQEEKRPYLILKLAFTLDGKIACRNGHSAWVSGEDSRALVQDLRSRVQAVAVGGRTFYADNPRLTARTAQVKDQPLAVVITSRLPRAEEDFHLLNKRPQELIFFSSKKAARTTKARELEAKGARVLGLDLKEGLLDLEGGLKRLFSELGCYYILCEGGGNLGLQLVERGLVDEMLFFIAPKILGDSQGTSSFSGREVLDMRQAYGLRYTEIQRVGEDLMLRLRPAL